MARPRKCRRVQGMPEHTRFGPTEGAEPGRSVVLTVDEFETIRLIDFEGFTQAECAEFMNVARTTIQSIYAAARWKLADALVNGVPLRIEGGDYEIDEAYCRRHHREGHAHGPRGGRGRHCRHGRSEVNGAENGNFNA